MGLLAAAGAISGAGEGASKAIQTAQVTLSQSQLQEQRANLEQERDARLEESAVAREGRQATHAEALQKLGFTHAENLQTGQQQFTRGENQATRTHAEQLQKQGFEHTETENAANREHTEALQTGQQTFTHKENEAIRQNAKDIADATNQRLKDMQTAELTSREKEGALNRGSEDYRASLQRESSERIASWTHDIAAEQLKDQREKLSLVTLGDGSIVKVDAKGNQRGFLTDAAGHKLIAGKDLDAKTKVQVEVMKTMMIQNGQVAERVAQTDPTEANRLLDVNKGLQRDIDTILGYKPATGGGKPAFVMPGSKAMSESPTANTESANSPESPNPLTTPGLVNVEKNPRPRALLNAPAYTPEDVQRYLK